MNKKKSSAGPAPLFAQSEDTSVLDGLSSDTSFQKLSPQSPNCAGGQDRLSRLDLDSTSQQRSPGCCGGWLWNRDSKSLVKLPCKRWDCPRCVRKKGGAVCKRMKLSGFSEKLNRVLTLPFDLGRRTWTEAIRDSGVILNRFFVSLRRCIGKFNYFWVREVGKKSNMVHFHVLVDRFISKALCSRLWGRAGGGYVVDIFRATKSTKYVYKYLLKVPQYAEDVKRALYMKRRFTTSSGLLAPSLKDPLLGKWLFLDIAEGSSLISNLWGKEHGFSVYSFDSGGFG